MLGRSPSKNARKCRVEKEQHLKYGLDRLIIIYKQETKEVQKDILSDEAAT